VDCGAEVRPAVDVPFGSPLQQPATPHSPATTGRRTAPSLSSAIVRFCSSMPADSRDAVADSSALAAVRSATARCSSAMAGCSAARNALQRGRGMSAVQSAWRVSVGRGRVATGVDGPGHPRAAAAATPAMWAHTEASLSSRRTVPDPAAPQARAAPPPAAAARAPAPAARKRAGEGGVDKVK
jgi:hypothetical protein